MTTINEATRSRISVLVNKILKKEGFLKEGDVARVSVDITQGSSFVVVKSSSQNEDHHTLTNVLNRMTLQRVRMESIIRNANLNIVAIKSWQTIPGYRNFGSKTYTELAHALIAEGVECGWAKALLAQLEFKTQEMERTEVKEIGPDGWVQMHDSLIRLRTKHTDTKLAILQGFKDSGNLAQGFRKVFPSKMHRSWWGTIRSLINSRWKRDGLLYRIQVVEKHISGDKLKDKYAIVTIAT